MALIFVSCDIFKSPEKVYPKNITIPGYGVLQYQNTLFDGKNIKDTMLDSNLIWSIDYYDGLVYRYDKKTKRIKTLNIEKQNAKTGESIYTFDLYIFVNNYLSIDSDNIIIPFVFNNEEKKNYIVKINRNDASFTYTKMPDIFDNYSFWDGTMYNERMYFRMSTIDYDGDLLRYSTADFENYSPITEEEYLSIDSSGHYSDTKNRLYYTEDSSTSRTETYLNISIDNGDTWYSGKMGTNYANKVIVDDDTVYVSCHKYYEVIGFFPTGSTGGGLHIFKWKYD